jgi:hypothetical protein
MPARPESENSPDRSESAGSAASVPDGLSERDARILAFERQWWNHAGAKEEAIRAQFELSAARYYQLLNAVIDLPGAVRTDPMLVTRLQRARFERTQSRAARAFTPPGPRGESSRPQPTESND